ncbi:MAG: NYN domain-containing protein [Candidatus Paceibacterota bacterium]
MIFIPSIINRAMENENNHAYIDGANLHKGIESLGWSLDYKKFRVWLREKHKVNKAFLFIGLIPENSGLYKYLQDVGFILVFKQIAYDSLGKVKGNCDSDLVLHTMKDFYEKEYNQAVIVTGDGDFASLVKFLQKNNKIRVVLAPEHKKCSILLKKTNVKLTFLEELKEKLS